MSNVFRQIKSNDVHQRPFKAYKRYRIDSTSIGPAHITQSGIYYGVSKDIHLPGRIDHNGEIPYPLNADGTNMYVAWHAIKQKYYDDRPDALPEHVLNPLNERSLFISSSTLTIPYHQVGERIKNNTFIVTSSIGDLIIDARDDGNGNLIDPLIDSTKFASASKNIFYMSFNDTFQEYREYKSTGLGLFSGSFSYELKGQKRQTVGTGDLFITPGVDATGSGYAASPSGLAVQFQETVGSQIRIPHDDAFNRFGHCDDWTISFWAKNNTSGPSTDVILSKHALSKKLVYNTEDNVIEFQDFTLANIGPPFIDSSAISESKARVPFHVTLASDTNHQTLFIEASDGTNNIHCPSLPVLNSIFHAKTANVGTWVHWAIRNSGSLLQIFANGELGGFSGSLPGQPTANEADVTIGSRTIETNEIQNLELAEIRMYDYAVSNEGVASLANNNFLSSSCYQTNVIGNVFHRNGQIVVSSPLPKYHTGSGFFGDDHTWNAEYRGVHTIYENQAFIRVPKDVLNVTVNPSSTYTPATDGGEICTTNQNNVLPGEVRKGLFISGTLKPYITTIGLYNDQSQLVAVGKLAQPIQKRDDIDMNFIVRWDY